MATYANFYETINEANMRLRNTVVVYDDDVYLVLAITNHKSDGIFRVYLEPIGKEKGKMSWDNHPNDNDCPYPPNYYSAGTNELGVAFDKWMDKYPAYGILRKHINSPLFKKFRPYPMGMCNIRGCAVFLERQPNRKSEQGLISTMLSTSWLPDLLSAGKNLPMFKSNDMYSAAFRDCVRGEYPTFEVCCEQLSNPDITNSSAAFHRLFAVVKGPVNTLFLVYKDKIVGLIPNADKSTLKIGKEYSYVYESVEELGLFEKIIKG